MDMPINGFEKLSLSDNRPNVKIARSWLQKRMRVELTDGRLVEGILECFDDSGNLILANAIDVKARYLMDRVIIPGKVQVKVSVYKPNKGTNN